MENKKCYECGGKILDKKVDFSLYGINLGKFDAEVCSKCGESFFSEQASDEIDKVAKEKGLWGLEKHEQLDIHTEVAIAKMSSQGRVVIPIAIREGFRTGEMVIFFKNRKMLIIRRAKDLGKKLLDDVKFAVKTNKALAEYKKGKFTTMDGDEFLKVIKKW